jgi:hypothetical protein
MDKDVNDWRKASYSNGSGDCMEVGHLSGNVAVRDTKDREGLVLNVSAEAWASFTASLK